MARLYYSRLRKSDEMIKRAIAKTCKNKAKTSIFTAILLAVLGITLAAPMVTVSAATPTPKQPLVWVDSDHSSAVDANNTVFKSLGYVCEVGGNTVTNSEGTSISKEDTPNGTTSATQLKEDGTKSKVEVPKCDNKVKAASYIWVSLGGEYMLIVDTDTSSRYDTKYCPVGKCDAGVRKLNKGVNGPVVFFAKSIKTTAVDPTKAAAANAAIAADNTANKSQMPNDTNASCENEAGVLGWIVCPVINSIANGVDGIYNNFIQPLLETQPLSIAPNKVDAKTGKNSNPNLIAWSSFRIIGDIFLVIVLLVIVFGQSIGGGLIDAYSAKKILPRLLAAAILINISFYVVALAVDVSNIVGSGIQSLLMAPFNISGEGIKIGYGGGALGVAAIIGSLFALKIAVVTFFEWIGMFSLAVLLPAILLMIAILGTLIFRQGLILLLIITSPVAFALYCLPNTEQYFRKWWDLLFKTLLVYPIIAVLFAMSNIFSVVITQANGVGGPFKELIGVIALFVPLFLIPFAFKLAGGFLGRLHEVTAGIGKRGVESIKGNPNDQNSLRNRTRRDMLSKFNERDLSGRAIGTRLNPTTAFGSRKELRKARLGAIRNMNHGVFGKLGTSNAMFEYNSQDSNVTGDLAKFATGEASRDAAKKDYLHEQALIEDKVRSGAMNTGSPEHMNALNTAKGNYEQRLFSSATADKIGRTQDMRRRAILNPATIGYEIAEGEEGWDQATGIMRDIAGGDEGVYRSMVNEFQYVAKSAAGRSDLAGATDGKPYDYKTGWSSQSLYQTGSGKPKAVASAGRNYLKDFKSSLDAPLITPDDHARVEAQLAESGRFYLELDQLAQGATGAVRDEAVKQKRAFEVAGIQDVLNTASNIGSGTIRDRAKVGARAYDREEAARTAQAPGDHK